MRKTILNRAVLMSSLLSATLTHADEASLQQQLDALKAELEALREQRSAPASGHKNWRFVSYGSMLYKHHERFSNVQDTTPEQRAKVDIERIVTEFEYKPAEHWAIEVEIEYEHGGTGSSMEYDGFEEFGEFETETEAGGEVVIEKAQIEYEPSEQFGLRFGRIHIPVGLGTRLHSPHRYFTTERHWGEASLIPQVWHESGIAVFGEWRGFNYQALLTTGLNSEFFRTTTWVAGGHQTRFEYVNADALATTLQLGYGNLRRDQGIAVTYYRGDTSDNRHKEGKITAAGTVELWSIHGAVTLGDATLRGQYLLGSLSDSAAIATANKNTPGLNAGAFTQVGSEAEALFVEAAYNISPLLALPQKLQVFAGWEQANPLKSVATGSASQRYDQTETSFGVNFYPLEALVLKAQLSHIDTAQSTIPDTQAFSLAAGYRFSL